MATTPLVHQHFWSSVRKSGLCSWQRLRCVPHDMTQPNVANLSHPKVFRQQHIPTFDVSVQHLYRPQYTSVVTACHARYVLNADLLTHTL